MKWFLECVCLCTVCDVSGTNSPNASSSCFELSVPQAIKHIAHKCDTQTATQRHGYKHTHTSLLLEHTHTLTDRHQVDAEQKDDRRVPLEKLTSKWHIYSNREKRDIVVSQEQCWWSLSAGKDIFTLLFRYLFNKYLIFNFICIFIYPRKSRLLSLVFLILAP